MKDFINDLKKQSFGPSRILFIEKAFDYLISLNRPVNILETGCHHYYDEPGFTGSFAYLIKNYTKGNLLSIDISFDSIRASKNLNKNFIDVIDYICGDSVSVINSLSDEFVRCVDLFILDSYDLDYENQHPSANHHLKELLSFFHRMNPHAWIAIDDNFLPGTWIEWKKNNKIFRFETNEKIVGKGSYCDSYLKNCDFQRDETVVIPGERNIFLYFKS